MKKKVPKILFIISIIIFSLGILCWFGIELLINETDDVTLLLSMFGILALKLLIFFITIGVVALIWFIYGMIILCQKIENGEIAWKNFERIGVLLAFIIFALISLIFLFTIPK